MISAYDRFFGGPESVGLGRFTEGREGSGLLPFIDVFPGPRALRSTALVFSVRVLLSKTGRGLGELLLGREASARATFTPAGRASSSAFLLPKIALGRGAGFVDGDGFSPEIDASKSRI
jgi:hypothetical protein